MVHKIFYLLKSVCVGIPNTMLGANKYPFQINAITSKCMWNKENKPI